MMLEMDTNEILGVQAVRNGATAGVFFASSSLIVSFGIFQNYLGEGPPQNLTSYDAKAMILAVLFFLAFLSFTLSVRLYTHLTFLMCLKPDDASIFLETSYHHNVEEQEGEGVVVHHRTLADIDSGRSRAQQDWIKVFPKNERFIATRNVYVAAVRTINQGAIAFSVGMRLFYCALPFGMWMFGSPGLIVGTVLLVIVVFPLDYTFLKEDKAMESVERVLAEKKSAEKKEEDNADNEKKKNKKEKKEKEKERKRRRKEKKGDKKKEKEEEEDEKRERERERHSDHVSILIEDPEEI